MRIANLVLLALAACTGINERPERFELGACEHTWIVNGAPFSDVCSKGCNAGAVMPLVSQATAESCGCANYLYAQSGGVFGCCLPEEVSGARQWSWKDCGEQ